MIYLDSSLLIYLVERHPRWVEQVEANLATAADTPLVISSLVKCECLLAPMRRGDPVLQRAYTELFALLGTLPLTDAVYLQAAELRARFSLRTPDALHLACAQYHRCEALWTNDERLARVSHGLARNIFSA